MGVTVPACTTNVWLILKDLEKFIARQSFDCTDNYSHLTEEGVEYLNGLCSWVAYEDSDDEEEEGEEEKDEVDEDA